MQPRIYIAVCSCRDWKPQFGASLSRMMYDAGRNGIEIFFNPIQGTSVLPRARQLLMQDAMSGGFTHILQLDDDEKFAPNLLTQLLSRDVDIVALNYARKDGSGQMMACDLEGKPMASKGKTGIEEAGWLPFGGILIKLDALKGIEKPWFEVRWLEDRKDFIGEDYYFCMKTRSHGLQLYVDHDASNKCRHIGDAEFMEAA